MTGWLRAVLRWLWWTPPDAVSARWLSAQARAETTQGTDPQWINWRAMQTREPE